MVFGAGDDGDGYADIVANDEGRQDDASTADNDADVGRPDDAAPDDEGRLDDATADDGKCRSDDDATVDVDECRPDYDNSDVYGDDRDDAVDCDAVDCNADGGCSDHDGYSRYRDSLSGT